MSLSILLTSIGTSLFVVIAEIVWTTQSPFFTFPKTTFLPSKCGHGAIVIKNCELFVLALPAFAILNTPGSSCYKKKIKKHILCI